MSYKAVLFGSIGTLAETSDLQRDAFNEAFKISGLDWFWDEDIYRKLLSKSGGTCLLYTSPSPRDGLLSRMPSSA